MLSRVREIILLPVLEVGIGYVLLDFHANENIFSSSMNCERGRRRCLRSVIHVFPDDVLPKPFIALALLTDRADGCRLPFAVCRSGTHRDGCKCDSAVLNAAIYLLWVYKRIMFIHRLTVVCFDEKRLE